MHFTAALVSVLALAVSSVVAAPLSQVNRYAALGAREVELSTRGCIKNTIDYNMAKIIYKTVRKHSKDPKVMLITMVTAYTETYINNLDCGDQDSLGLFQQRASKGWGTPAQLQNPVYSTEKFLSVLMGVYNKNPGRNAGEIAQAVQLAEAGNQYTKNLKGAQAVIDKVEAELGTGGDNGDDEPSSTSTKPPHTEEPTHGGNGGAINVGGPTETQTDEPQPTETSGDHSNSDDDCDESLPKCTKYYRPIAGDNCYKVAKKHGLKLADFYELNQEIDEHCQNLIKGQPYCVAVESN